MVTPYRRTTGVANGAGGKDYYRAIGGGGQQEKVELVGQGAHQNRVGAAVVSGVALGAEELYGVKVCSGGVHLSTKESKVISA